MFRRKISPSSPKSKNKPSKKSASKVAPDFKLVSCFTNSSTLKMEVNFRGLHGVIYQKIELLKYFILNYILAVLLSPNCVSIVVAFIVM
jgi:hypothetical protein